VAVCAAGSTYGHLLPDSEQYLRGLLDRFDGGLNALLSVDASGEVDDLLSSY
jgi:hypothetical protein